MVTAMPHETGWGVETFGSPMCGTDTMSPARYRHPPFSVQLSKARSSRFRNPRLSAEQAHRCYLNVSCFTDSESGSGFDNNLVQARGLRDTSRKRLSTHEIPGAMGAALLEVEA